MKFLPFEMNIVNVPDSYWFVYKKFLISLATMKILIGVIGEKGAGKGTFTKLFKSAASSEISIANIKSSDILAKTLHMWDIPLTRSNLQQLAIIMDKQYGQGSLSHAIKNEIMNAKEDIIIFEGIRWPSDVEMVRSFPNNIIVAVHATPEIRYERIKLRNEKVGESNASFEQFMEEEKVATETQIVELGKKADVQIDNNAGEGEFAEKVKEFYKGLSV